MSDFAFWKPIIIGIIATPIALFVTIDSAGIGHGSYLPMAIFYPISSFLLLSEIAADGIEDAFLKMIVGNGVTVLAIVIAIIQFPLYGFIIGFSRAKKEPTWFTVLEIIVWIHIAISAVALPFALISAVL
jgi:hypothetical protein